MKTVLLICGASNTVINFRSTLIKNLTEEKYRVAVIAFDNKCENEIRNLGVEFFSLDDSTRGINPLKVLTLKNKYYKIIKKVAPDIVLTFTLKPNSFGVLAAKKAKIEKVFSFVEGAGDVFIKNSLKWKLLRVYVSYLFKKSFKFAKKVFFLNTEDRQEFVKRNYVRAEQCVQIPGIGIDLEKFCQQPLINYNTFLMVARLIKSKGVFEYCEVARKVKSIYPDAVFNLVGPEGDVKINDIKEYLDDGSINYLGETKDVRPFLKDCTVYVLPSYREGVPVSIMEAEAVGRPVVTFDSVGCRDTVVDGQNGFLVERLNKNALAEKLLLLCGNKQLIDAFSQESRLFVEKKFDSRKINAHILKVIED